MHSCVPPLKTLVVAYGRLSIHVKVENEALLGQFVHHHATVARGGARMCSHLAPRKGFMGGEVQAYRNSALDTTLSAISRKCFFCYSPHNEFVKGSNDVCLPGPWAHKGLGEISQARSPRQGVLGKVS